ncbi:hypothetical protein D3C76_692440 [compost metagenome]
MPASPQSTELCRYRYDPLDRRVASTLHQQTDLQHFYCKSHLASEIQGAQHRSIFQHDDQLLAQQSSQNAKVDTTLLATDQQRSVLNTQSATQSQAFAYTPYGERSPKNGLPSLLGFKGERLDPLTGNYDLGNGYRRYNTWLKRFDSPDSLSPFGEGGLNTYGFVAGDPVNRSDPTGHFPVSKLLIGAFPVGAFSAGIATLLIDDKDWKPVLLGITIGLTAATVALPLILRARPKQLGLNRTNTARSAVSQQSSNAPNGAMELNTLQTPRRTAPYSYDDPQFEQFLKDFPPSKRPLLRVQYEQGTVPFDHPDFVPRYLQDRAYQKLQYQSNNARISQVQSTSASGIRIRTSV